MSYYNEPAHCRPLLPTYEQATSVYYAPGSLLRLPDYRECYLIRYNPYGRSQYHKRVDCRDESPAYEATMPHTHPTHRPEHVVYLPLEEGPEKRQVIRRHVQEFFDWLATMDSRSQEA